MKPFSNRNTEEHLTFFAGAIPVMRYDVGSILQNPDDSKRPSAADHNFPLICAGSSASGLDAHKRLLGNSPVDLGTAVVIVNHLRKTTTLLHEILTYYTQMPVKLISERLDVKPNYVFVIPPQRDLRILGGRILSQADSKPRGMA